MSVNRRLMAVAVAFLVPALLLARWSIGSAASGPAPVLTLPNQVGAWHATQDEQLDAETWAIIEPDAHMLRRYEAPGRTSIWIYLGLYVGRSGSGKAAHDPEICYPAQGWEIMQSRSQDVALPSEEMLPVTLLEAQNGSRKETVLYWFQPAARWPESAALEQLMRVYDAMAGRPQYAFVRFSAASDGSSQAADDLVEFAGAIASAVRTSVENSRGTGGSPTSQTSL